MNRWRLDERGSATAELTLLVPGLIVLLLFVVFCGRLASARLNVDDAAHQAARAATLARSVPQATRNAHSTAQSTLKQAGVTCQNLTVDVQTGALTPGSTVTITISCQIGVSDLVLLGAPGRITATATAASIVDRWRGTTAEST